MINQLSQRRRRRDLQDAHARPGEQSNEGEQVMRKHAFRAARPAFTLVELLVVIGIITILAALGTWGAFAAMRVGREAAVSYEINQLSMALEKYKNDIGDYPPDGLNRNVTQRHITSYFRRANLPGPINANGTPPVLPQFDTVNLPANQRVDPSEALVFWLALVGKNKQNPFPNAFVANPPTSNSKLETALQYLRSDLGIRRFEFKTGRLTDYDGDGWPEYCPEFSDLSPYVYYHHDTYDLNFSSGTVNLPAYAHPQGNGIARPYLATPTSGTTPTQFMAPRKFQIISAGLDGFYSNAGEVVGTDVFKSYPGGANYTPEDEDNITSFSEGSTLGNKRP
jgi:prepilin-type N-terminal cleavage/methylation domain-containing protein